MTEPMLPQEIPRRQRAYKGPACPRCRRPLDLALLPAGETRCPKCNHTFLAAPFHPPAAREWVASLAEAGPDGAAPCALHTGNAAIGSCTRCGVFFCALCRIRVDDQELCPGCFDRLTAEGRLSSAHARIYDYRGMAMSLGVFGLLIFCFGLITGPLTLFLVSRAVRQRRQSQESGGVAALAIAALLGLAQIAIGLLFLIGVFVDATKGAT
jgi:hypothetical protein